MVDAWPPGLPQAFQANSFNEGVADGLIESQTDTGPPMTRRRTSASARPVSGQMIVTSAQIATLRTFFDTTLAGGSLPFNFPAAATDTGTWLVKFPKSGLPKWSSLGGDSYTLSLSLMILP